MSVKSGPSICFNNSVKEDYFAGLLLRAIKQRDTNPPLREALTTRRSEYRLFRLRFSFLLFFLFLAFASFFPPHLHRNCNDVTEISKIRVQPSNIFRAGYLIFDIGARF